MRNSWLLKELNLKLEEVFNAFVGDDRDVIIINKDMGIVWANHNFEKQVGKLKDIKGKFCYQVHQNRGKPCENCTALKSFITGRL